MTKRTFVYPHAGHYYVWIFEDRYGLAAPIDAIRKAVLNNASHFGPVEANDACRSLIVMMRKVRAFEKTFGIAEPYTDGPRNST